MFVQSRSSLQCHAQAEVRRPVDDVLLPDHTQTNSSLKTHVSDIRQAKYRWTFANPTGHSRTHTLREVADQLSGGTLLWMCSANLRKTWAPQLYPRKRRKKKKKKKKGKSTGLWQCLCDSSETHNYRMSNTHDCRAFLRLFVCLILVGATAHYCFSSTVAVVFVFCMARVLLSHAVSTSEPLLIACSCIVKKSSCFNDS